MTDKQEKILMAALELFANEGYNATSTNKVARKAGVSEGLIFRHFQNKKALLDAIMQDAEARIAHIFAPIIFEQDPKEVVRKLILLPFSIDPSAYDFWKLQFKLKWESGYHNPDKMKPLVDKLTWAFTELEYADPVIEARWLNQSIDAIAAGILKEGIESQKPFKAFLLNKYGV